MQPLHWLYSLVSHTTAEVWQVRKSQKLDTPVAAAHSNPCHHASRGRRGHSTQNITTLRAAANLNSLVDPDNSQHKGRTNKECVSTVLGHHKLLKRLWQRLQNFPWHFILQVIGWWQQKMSRLSYSSGISSHSDWDTVTLTEATPSAEKIFTALGWSPLLRAALYL